MGEVVGIIRYGRQWYFNSEHNMTDYVLATPEDCSAAIQNMNQGWIIAKYILRNNCHTKKELKMSSTNWLHFVSFSIC